MTTTEQAVSEAFVRRGKGNPPVPIESQSDVICMKGCPDCGGRGWFLISPFKTGGTNGAGGLRNMTQCLTCLDASEYWGVHGTLPQGLELTT